MVQNGNKAEIIIRLCELLIDNKKSEGIDFAKEHYPFVEIDKLHSRQYSKFEMMKIYLRDGFIDRYSGEKLLFPGLIRLLTLEIPDIFKYHLNWKMSETHMIYWDLFPTIDHIVPIARGGSNTEDNWITTNQLRNSAKSNFTIQELGWEILPKGKLEDWDGLCSVFIKWVNNEKLEEKYKHTEDWKYILGWFEALIQVQNNSTKNKSKILVSPFENKTNDMFQANDLKNYPVGTIAKVKSTQNKCVILKRGKEGTKYYSNSENMVLTINPKKLLVDIEFRPEQEVSSIVELPTQIYTNDQLEFIKKACRKLCNGNYKNLFSKELPSNTIYQYLLKY